MPADMVTGADAGAGGGASVEAKLDRSVVVDEGRVRR